MSNNMLSTGYQCIPHLNTYWSCRTILSVPCRTPEQFECLFQKDMGQKSWVGFLQDTRAKQNHKSLQALLDISFPHRAREQLSFCYKTSHMYQRINGSGSASFQKQPVNTSAVLSIQVLLLSIPFLPSDNIQSGGPDTKWVLVQFCRHVLTSLSKPSLQPPPGTVTLWSWSRAAAPNLSQWSSKNR